MENKNLPSYRQKSFEELEKSITTVPNTGTQGTYSLYWAITSGGASRMLSKKRLSPVSNQETARNITLRAPANRKKSAVLAVDLCQYNRYK